MAHTTVEISFFQSYEIRPMPGSDRGVEIWGRLGSLVGTIYKVDMDGWYVKVQTDDHGPVANGTRRSFTSALSLAMKLLTST